ncbi:hypothetical protein T440DRAFT_181104 [Plenodomus tracheiphilus IPT5]|uniref:Uncharacterized protein n=1 Tax=Plenodomus tracheiphilus IPT5 TaxID=1408161 RepID=A0A6A7B0Q8_9PLEO|nr:hypothetical protein T440DRAFT_181104 [Plenodomus tracheiphilus IPT5]
MFPGRGLWSRFVIDSAVPKSRGTYHVSQEHHPKRISDTKSERSTLRGLDRQTLAAVGWLFGMFAHPLRQYSSGRMPHLFTVW